MEKVIAIIDLKSFYASVECACRHLDIFSTPLVCCDPYRSSSSVVMSVTPYLKEKYGVPNVCRRRDLPDVPGMIFAVPRMAYYLTVSARVADIFLDFVAEEDLHVYSVDEAFLNLGPYLSLYGGNPEKIVRQIQKRIKDELGLLATAAIGPNMFLAKTALDLEGKKKPPYLAHWTQDDVQKKLWKVKPLSKIWSIAGGTESHLNRIGIRTLEELAKADDDFLSREFGIMGKQLKDLANGIDDSDIAVKYVPKETSLHSGQTLYRAYSVKEAKLLLREMSDELAYRMRRGGGSTSKVSLGINYENGIGYARERALPFPIDDSEMIYEALMQLLFEAKGNLPIRGLYIAFGHISYQRERQLPLFADPEAVIKRESLTRKFDKIRTMYGKDAIMRCSSLKEGSTLKQRHGQIGGHKR